MEIREFAEMYIAWRERLGEIARDLSFYAQSTTKVTSGWKNREREGERESVRKRVRKRMREREREREKEKGQTQTPVD